MANASLNISKMINVDSIINDAPAGFEK